MPFVVGKGSVIKCWDQGFIGLATGAKADLICPPDYAYGNRAMGSTIPANSPLLFSIEVVKIEPAAKKEEPKKEEPKKAEPTSESNSEAPVFSVTVTEEGEGVPLAKGEKVKAHYRGTLLDGTEFDASYNRGMPLDFVVGKGGVIKCWD